MSRFYFDLVILSLLLPAGAGAGCVLLGRVVSGKGGQAVAAQGPGLGVFLAIFALGWLKVWPEVRYEWLPFLALAGGLGYALALVPSLPSWWGMLVSLEVGVLCAWLLLPDWTYALYLKESRFWLLLLPQAVMAGWWTFLWLAKRSSSVGPLLGLACWALLGAKLLFDSGNARFAQMAFMVVACLLGALSLSLARGFRPFLAHALPGAATVLVCLIVLAYLYSRSDWEEASPYDIPRSVFLVLLAAPLPALLTEAPGLNRMPVWLKGLAQVLLIVGTAALAIYLGNSLPEPMPEGGDEWG